MTALQNTAPPAIGGCSIEGADEKPFYSLRARLALAGYMLARSEESGLPTFMVGRWGLMSELADLDAVEDFARRVGAVGYEQGGVREQ